MLRAGFLNLPSWQEALRASLLAGRHPELLHVPVLNAEDAEPDWSSLGPDEFFGSVDVGFSFADRPPVHRLPDRVITADPELALRLQSERGSDRVGVRGAIGGTWPVLELAGPDSFLRPPRRLTAITDGVANALLTILENGGTLETAMHEIQWRGLVTGNPTRHLHGLLARQRLCLLASRLFHHPFTPDDVFLEGMNRICAEDLAILRQLRYRMRLIGSVGRGDKGWEAWIRPCVLPESHPLARLEGHREAAQVADDSGESQLFAGPGQTREITVRGMLRDLLEMNRTATPSVNGSSKEPLVAAAEIPASYYLRVSLVNFVSTLAQLTELLSRSGIELAAISQTGSLSAPREQVEAGKAVNDLILFTRPVPESILLGATARLGWEIRLATLQACWRLEGPGLHTL